MPPAVVVLLPAYRAAATLPRAVHSLLGQSLGDWEAVIAADDGCDYLALLAEAGIRDPRLRQVATGRLGSGDHGARNVALAAAGPAPFLALLDADDALAPEHLGRLLPLAERHGGALADSETHDEAGRAYKRAFPDRTAPFAMTAADILGPRTPFFPLFRRELAGAGWPAVPFCADVLFSLLLASRLRRAGGALLCLPEPLYRYHKTPGSLTNSAATPQLAEAGYDAILALLAGETLDLEPDIRAAAVAEFTANRRVNRLFARWLAAGRCSSLEDFLDRTENGRAAWLTAEAPLAEGPGERPA